MEKLMLAVENFPWMLGRENPEAKPVYKIVARSMSSSGDSIVMLHKAGCDFVVNYFIRDLVNNKKEVLEKMDIKEANLLRWVISSEVTDPLLVEKS